MEMWQWILFAGMFAAGGLIGYALSRGKSDNMGKVRELEDKLQQRDDELAQYKQDVNAHFGKTAELVNALTDDYRAVYEHLAAGSQALCGDTTTKLSAQMPETKKLNEQSAVEKDETASSTIIESKESANEETTELKPEAEETNKAKAAPTQEKSAEDAARTIH